MANITPALIKPRHPFGTESLRSFFLLLFTKELIKQSSTTEVLELKTLLKEKKEELPKMIKEKIKEKTKEISEEGKYLPSILRVSKELPLLPKKLPVFNLIQKPPLTPKKKFLGRLKIPETVLPTRLRYIQPTPTQRQLNLEKLNPLIQDLMVNAIECNGPGEEIFVNVRGMRKKQILF